MFQKYIISEDSVVKKESSGGWGMSDRLQFEISAAPELRAEVVVGGLDVWPFTSRRLTLTVDGEQIARV